MTRQPQQTAKFVESQRRKVWSLTTMARGRFAAFAGGAASRPIMCSALMRMSTAYHEGGHAVASYAAWPQHPVESATIIPADGYLGMVRHAEQDDSWRADVQDEGMAAALAAESETVIYLAGHLAEVRFLDGIAEVPYQFERTSDSLSAQDASSGTWDGEVTGAASVPRTAPP